MIKRFIAILLVLLMFFSPLLGSKEPVLAQEVDEETKRYQQLLYYMGDSMIDRISNEVEEGKEEKIGKIKDIKTDIKGATKIGKLEYAEYLKEYILVLNKDYILEKSETYLSDKNVTDGLGMIPIAESNPDELYEEYKNYVVQNENTDRDERKLADIEVFYRKEIENENDPFNPWRDIAKRDKFFGINEEHKQREVEIKFYNNEDEYFKLEKFTLYGDDYFNEKHTGNEIEVFYIDGKNKKSSKKIKLKNLAYQSCTGEVPENFISKGADPEFRNPNRNIFKTSFNIEGDEVISGIKIKFDKKIVGRADLPGIIGGVGRQRIKGRIFEIDYHGKLVRDEIYLKDLDYGKAQDYIEQLEDEFSLDVKDILYVLRNVVDILERDLTLKNLSIDSRSDLEDFLDEFTKYLNIEKEEYDKDFFNYLLFISMIRKPDKRLVYDMEEFEISSDYNNLNNAIESLEGKILGKNEDPGYIKVKFKENVIPIFMAFRGNKYYTFDKGDYYISFRTEWQDWTASEKEEGGKKYLRKITSKDIDLIVPGNDILWEFLGKKHFLDKDDPQIDKDRRRIFSEDFKRYLNANKSKYPREKFDEAKNIILSMTSVEEDLLDKNLKRFIENKSLFDIHLALYDFLTLNPAYLDKDLNEPIKDEVMKSMKKIDKARKNRIKEEYIIKETILQSDTKNNHEDRLKVDKNSQKDIEYLALEGYTVKGLTVKDLYELRNTKKADYDMLVDDYTNLVNFSLAMQNDKEIFRENDWKIKKDGEEEKKFWQIKDKFWEIDEKVYKDIMETNLASNESEFKSLRDEIEKIDSYGIKYKILQYNKKNDPIAYKEILDKGRQAIDNRRYVFKERSEPGGDYKFIKDRMNQTLITDISYIPFHVFLNGGKSGENTGYRTYSVAEYTYILDTIYKPNYLLNQGQKEGGFYSSWEELYKENSDITKGEPIMDVNKEKAIIDSDLDHSFKELLFTVKFVDEGHEDLRKKPLVYMNRKSINPIHTEDKIKLEHIYVDKGIVHVAFSDDEPTGVEELDWTGMKKYYENKNNDLIKRIVDLEKVSNISVEKENYICKALEGENIKDENDFNIYIYPLMNTEKGINYMGEGELLYGVEELDNYYSEYDPKIKEKNLITYIYGEKDEMLPLTGKFFTREKYLVAVGFIVLFSYLAIKTKKSRES